jgi:hypothetical protein
MTDTKSPDGVTARSIVDKPSFRVELWLLVLMMVLALAGVGVTQAVHSGGKLYWLFLVLVYAAISLALAWRGHASVDQRLWPMIRAQVFHWLGALVAINIVLFFESVDIASRGAAADYSLLILALSCFLAGVHINWVYMPLGVVLAVTAVGLGYLDQLSVYVLVVPVAVLAVWVFAKHKLGTTTGA